MPEAWLPKIEKRKHPFGEEGVRSSLEEVAKKASAGALDPRVRAWAIECLERARRDGCDVSNPRGRATVLLKAVQKKLWVPDPIGSEFITGSHLMTCVDKDSPCFHGGDCFPEGTAILAEGHELVAIETLKPGMKIWGLDRWSEVEAVKYKGILPIDVVTLNNGSELKLTADHHVYVLDCVEHPTIDEDGRSLPYGWYFHRMSTKNDDDGEQRILGRECSCSQRREKRIRVTELRAGMALPRPEASAPSEFFKSRDQVLRVRKIEREVISVPCWDIQTDDHRVYLPEHDVTVSNCDDLSALLASSFASVGLYTMIVGQSYSSNKSIGHVLTAVWFEDKWHYAEPSVSMELGKCTTPFTRERCLSFPEVQVVCDDANCLRNGARFDPDRLGFVKQGTFVGVDGLPMEPRVVWLGQEVTPWGEYTTSDTCSKYPNGLDEDTLTEYASKCGKEAAVKYIEDETGIAIGACAEQESGDIPECVANNYGITLEIVVDGEVQWEAVYQDAGAVGGIVVCAATGVGAATLPLCGKLGGEIGKIAFMMTEGFVSFADGFGKLLGLWGSSDPYLVSCERTLVEPLQISVAIARAMSLGASYVPQNAKLPGPVLSANTTIDNKTYWGRMLSMRGMAVLTAAVMAQMVRDTGASPPAVLRALEPAAPEQWEELVRVGLSPSQYPKTPPSENPERYEMTLGAFFSSLEPGWGTDVIVPRWKKLDFWNGIKTYGTRPTSIKAAFESTDEGYQQGPSLGPFEWQYFATFQGLVGPPCPKYLVTWGRIEGEVGSKIDSATVAPHDWRGSTEPMSIRAFRMPATLHRIAQKLSDAEFKQMLNAWQQSVTTGLADKTEKARAMAVSAPRRSGIAPILGLAAAGAAAWWVSTIT